MRRREEGAFDMRMLFKCLVACIFVLVLVRGLFKIIREPLHCIITTNINNGMDE